MKAKVYGAAQTARVETGEWIPAWIAMVRFRDSTFAGSVYIDGLHSTQEAAKETARNFAECMGWEVEE